MQIPYYSSMQSAKELQQGRAVDIVIADKVVKHSFIQDLRGNRIVLLQTTPPLNGHYLDREILITYLVRNGTCKRFGFRGRVTQLCEGYITVGRGFPAIVVERTSETSPCDLRMHHRTPSPPCVELWMGTEKLNVVDISSGGSHVVRKDGTGTPDTQDVVTLTVKKGATCIQRRARLIRRWHTKGRGGPEHLALKFLETLPSRLLQTEIKLFRKISEAP